MEDRYRPMNRTGAACLPTLLLALLGMASIACSAPATQAQGGEKPATLRVGLVPNQAPDRVKSQYEPFRAYLSKALGQPVDTFVATDYAGVVEAMASDKLDLAYFGGLTYAQAEKR